MISLSAGHPDFGDYLNVKQTRFGVQMSFQEKICLVTGANAGIGLETARGLAQRGATVVLAVRNLDKGRAALDDIRETTNTDRLSVLHLDLASLESVRNAAETFLQKHDRLDILVNNAGLILDRRETTKEGFETTFGVNHLGHFLFTLLLLKALQNSPAARIINLSSDAHRASRGLDFADLNREKRRYSAMGAYGDSKLANIYFTTELARRLQDTAITAYAVHPGGVNTRFGKDGDIGGWMKWLFPLVTLFFRTPSQGAETSMVVATQDGIEAHNGGYFANRKPTTPTRIARNAESARKLWEMSEEMVGTSFESSFAKG